MNYKRFWDGVPLPHGLEDRVLWAAEAFFLRAVPALKGELAEVLFRRQFAVCPKDQRVDDCGVGHRPLRRIDGCRGRGVVGGIGPGKARLKGGGRQQVRGQRPNLRRLLRGEGLSLDGNLRPLGAAIARADPVRARGLDLLGEGFGLFRAKGQGLHTPAAAPKEGGQQRQSQDHGEDRQGRLGSTGRFRGVSSLPAAGSFCH